MFDFHEKRKIRSLLYSKPVIAVLVLLSGFLAVSAYNRYEIAAETKERLEARQAELDKLEERAQMLEARVEHLKDERGVEEELRTRFDVAKEGEEVVIILEDAEVDVVSPEPPSAPSEPAGSFFDRFKFWE
jgi:cell division protein FtsB